MVSSSMYLCSHESSSRRSATLADSSDVESTTVLQEEEDGKPAITLTTYKHGSCTRGVSTPLLNLVDPIIYKELDTFSNPAINTPIGVISSKYPSTSPSVQEVSIKEDAPHLMQLRSELEEHFQGLRLEFEKKTGRTWTPLEPWRNECEWSEEFGETCDAFDW